MEPKAETTLGAVLTGQANPKILDWWHRRTGKAITRNLIHAHMFLSLVRTGLIMYACYHLLRYDDVIFTWSIALVSLAVAFYQTGILGFATFSDTVKIAAQCMELTPVQLLLMDFTMARERAEQRLRFLDHECYRAERRKDLEVGFFADLEHLSALREYKDAQKAFVLLGLAEPRVNNKEE